MPNNKGYPACMLYLVKSVAFNNDNRQKDKLIYRSTVVVVFFSHFSVLTMEPSYLVQYKAMIFFLHSSKKQLAAKELLEFVISFKGF